MDSHNYYYMQLVVDSDLDDIYTDVLAMERVGLRVNHGLCQVAAADGDAHEFGGIARGLVVTKAATKSVYVSAGTACDASGRKITLGSQATVPLTNIGQTPVGSLTGAATGVAIAITAAKEAWVSLYIQYGELESDPRVDGDDDTVNFRVSESFRFFIAIGSEATPPALDRAGLSDSYVHLADILLDDAETIESIDPGGGARDVICCASADFDYFDGTGRDYSGMHGHRGDWLVLENATDFPAFAAAGVYVREGTARAAIYELAKLLQSTDSDAIQCPSVSGVWDYPASDSPSNLVSGTLTSQLEALLEETNKRVSLAGGSGAIIQPTAGQNGLAFNVANMGGLGKAQIELHAKRTADGVWAKLGLNRGHIAIPHLFYDDFMYAGDTAGEIIASATYRHACKWGYRVTDGVAQVLRDDAPGGILKLTTGATVTNATHIATGYNGSGATSGGWWKAGSAPYALFQVRFRLPSTNPTQGITFGFGLVDYRSTVGGEAYDVNVSSVLVYYAHALDKLVAWIKGYGTGTGYGTQVDLNGGADVTPDRWYTARCIVTGSRSAVFQLTDDTDGEDAETNITLADGDSILEDHVYNGVLFARNDESSGDKAVHIDSFMAADAALQAGM